jgi:hypothetical protein
MTFVREWVAICWSARGEDCCVRYTVSFRTGSRVFSRPDSPTGHTDVLVNLVCNILLLSIFMTPSALCQLDHQTIKTRTTADELQ